MHNLHKQRTITLMLIFIYHNNRYPLCLFEHLVENFINHNFWMTTEYIIDLEIRLKKTEKNSPTERIKTKVMTSAIRLRIG